MASRFCLVMLLASLLSSLLPGPEVLAVEQIPTITVHSGRSRDLENNAAEAMTVEPTGEEKNFLQQAMDGVKAFFTGNKGAGDFQSPEATRNYNDWQAATDDRLKHKSRNVKKWVMEHNLGENESIADRFDQLPEDADQRGDDWWEKLGRTLSKTVGKGLNAFGDALKSCMTAVVGEKPDPMRRKPATPAKAAPEPNKAKDEIACAAAKKSGGIEVNASEFGLLKTKSGDWKKEKSAYSTNKEKKYVSIHQCQCALPAAVKNRDQQYLILRMGAKTACCRVTDVGPWFVKDLYWEKAERGCRPLADKLDKNDIAEKSMGGNGQRITQSQPAGIDLTPACWDQLTGPPKNKEFMRRQGKVKWDFHDGKC